jgi:hypothetical protein
MLVTVRNNDNTTQNYIFEPNGISRTAEVISFYRNSYKAMRIQGFKVIDDLGNTIANGGSI